MNKYAPTEKDKLVDLLSELDVNNAEDIASSLISSGVRAPIVCRDEFVYFITKSFCHLDMQKSECAACMQCKETECESKYVVGKTKIPGELDALKVSALIEGFPHDYYIDESVGEEHLKKFLEDHPEEVTIMNKYPVKENHDESK